MVSPFNAFSQRLVNVTIKLSLLLTVVNFILNSVLILTRKQITAVEPSQVVSPISRKFDRYLTSVQSTWRRDELNQLREKYFLRPDTEKSIVPNVPLLQYPFTQASLLKLPQRIIPELQSRLSQLSKKDLDEPNSLEGAKHFSNHISISRTDPSDIYFSVRTTSANHENRLSIMIDTWIAMVSEQVKITTDVDDGFIRKQVQKLSVRQPQIIVADCSIYSRSKWALFCKTYWELKHFMLPHIKEKWFCHFDDDTYVNVIALMDMLNDFDPLTPIYIGRSLSQPTITRVYKSNDESNKPQYLARREWNHTDISYLAAFNFALGGAGYCLSRALIDKIEPYFEGPTIIRTAASISLPDDCVIGFIITHLLNTSMVNSFVMHSHLEDFSEFSFEDFFSQVTFPVNSKTLPDVNKRTVASIERSIETLSSPQNQKSMSEAENPEVFDYEFVLKFHDTLVKDINI